MYRVSTAVAGALLLTGLIFAIPSFTSPAAAYCAACRQDRPDSVQTRYRTINHTRVVNHYRTIPRTRVVDRNRLVLHRTIVNHRYNTLVHNHVRYQDNVVYRTNTGHRYAEVDRASYNTRQYTTFSRSLRVHYVRGTDCNCGVRPHSRQWY